ncbi:MAG: glucosamine-6-phosphate deaminase [Peptostreptococcaceae bacterium]
MRIIICENYDEMSKKAAAVLSSQIILNPESNLGLATGSTPEGMYKNIIDMYNNDTIDFSSIKTFNLDEYFGLEKQNDQSYDYFMKKHLFNHVNIKEENINIPNGIASNPEEECARYEKVLAENNVDLQILGIGSNAHIGFNEPSDHFNKQTSLVDLNESTIEANARFFENKEDVPKKAFSMGIGTIMKSKKIVLLASGENKAQAIYDTLNSEITPQIPSSILQLHKDVTIIVDKDAAKLLNK